MNKTTNKKQAKESCERERERERVVLSKVVHSINEHMKRADAILNAAMSNH